MINLKNEEIDNKNKNIPHTEQHRFVKQPAPDSIALAKNRKKFFINCFGCKIYYE